VQYCGRAAADRHTQTHTDRQTDRHTDVGDHNTFRVVYDSHEMSQSIIGLFEQLTNRNR